jgi:predicted ATP-dependent serine protease
MATDTVFCTECGSEIRRQAELCPGCGVPNELADTTQTASPGTGPESHEWTPFWWLDKQTVAKWGKYYLLVSLVGAAMLFGTLLLAIWIIF